jgi:hypothetical protein
VTSVSWAVVSEAVYGVRAAGWRMPVGAVHVITGPIGIGEIPFGVTGPRGERISPRRPASAGWRPGALDKAQTRSRGDRCARDLPDARPGQGRTPRPSCGTRTGRPKPRRYSSRSTPRARSVVPAESAGRGLRMRFGSGCFRARRMSSLPTLAQAALAACRLDPGHGHEAVADHAELPHLLGHWSASAASA